MFGRFMDGWPVATVPDFCTAVLTQLCETVKPAKVAIVVIMRKLLKTANALVKADHIWVGKCHCA